MCIRDSHIYYDKGFELKTYSVKLDLKKGTAMSIDTVIAHGPTGEIKAEGLQIIERGKRIKFLGKSTAKLRASRKAGS